MMDGLYKEIMHIKDKVKIVFLSSIVMTTTKWLISELNYLEKNSDTEVHELCDFLYPLARKTHEKTHQSKKIFTFKKFSDWKNYILNLQQRCIKDGKKLIILTELTTFPGQGKNLRYLKINQFLKQRQIDYYEIMNGGLIPSTASKETYLKYFKINRYWRYLLMRLNEVMTAFFGILLNVKPKGVFIAGDKIKKQFENLKITKGIELIDFNSWEFSSTLNKKNNDEHPPNVKYAVFLNQNSIGDRMLHKLPLNIGETPEKWYPSLDNFFSRLEKTFNVEIIIASHPKSGEEGCLDYLGNRTAVLNKTGELVRGAEFVIGKSSTALTYAIAHKKPLIFVYSKESKRNMSSYIVMINLSNYFKIKPIDIDETFSESQLKSIKNFDKKLCENYKTDFLASNPINKNYQIILEHFNK